MNRIYWIGPIVDTKNQTLSKAISSAANIWQREFINGLIANGVHVTALTYMPDQVWPKGKLWINYPKSEELSKKFNVISVGYLNLYLVRDLWIPLGLLIKVVFSTGVKTLYSYNVPFRHTFFAALFKLIHPRVKWVSIIADEEARGNPDYHIFLSYAYYNRFQGEKKYFLDGGVPLTDGGDSEKINHQPKVLLYAGTISEWTGIEDFCRIFNSISSEVDLELHIYGKGDSEEILQMASTNSRIKFFGFAPEEDLHIACKNAYAFVNPRPLEAYLGDNNFPSKLLMYLSYKKPILSTKTSNLSPAYDSLLIYYNDIDSFKRGLQEIISSKDEYQKRSNIILEYARENSWKSKIGDLLPSIDSIE